MTFTISIIDWLVSIYWLLENYIFVRSEELKVKRYNEYFQQLVQLDDCSQFEDNLSTSNVESSVQPVIESARVVSSKPDLGDAANGLFAELQQELLEVNDQSGFIHFTSSMEEEIEDGGSFVIADEAFSLADHDEEPAYVEYYHEPVIDTESEVPMMEEDCIQIGDLLNEEGPVSPKGFESFASAKINDKLDGAQQWVVSVIGIEEQYIHVSDGKRKWINIGERASRIRMNDVLILDVIRDGKEIVVENLIRVDSLSSEEYSIPDEDYYFQEENERIAI